MKKNVAVQVLDFISASGSHGRRFTEIQKFAWNAANPGAPYPKNIRAWWCTNLTGYCGHKGLLDIFAWRNAQRRWVRNSVHHNGRPFSKKHKMNFCNVPWGLWQDCSAGLLTAGATCSFGSCT